MIRFLIDKFRHAPGPLKQPRLIIADLADEVTDLIRQYLGKSNPETIPGETATLSSVPQPSKADIINTTPSTTLKKESPPTPNPEIEVSPELRSAISKSENLRRQDFKILALLLDAKNKNMMALSANALSEHGKKIGISIRHENIRKVIRIRLAKYVTTKAKDTRKASVYRYEINTKGIEYFRTTYVE